MAVIERNKRCYCGSMKKFKNCCIDKEGELYLVGENYNGEKIVSNKKDEELMLTKINKHVTKLLIAPSSELNHTNLKELTEQESLEILDGIYRGFDDWYKGINQYASCKKGCTSCCELYVDTSPLEARLIINYIENNFSEEQQKKLKGRIAENDKNVPTYSEVVNNPSIREEYAYKKIKCSFLTDEGSCSIYPVRPFNCRKHIVFSHPNLCEDLDSKIVQMFQSELIESTSKLINDMNFSVYRFDYYIGDKRYLKHITKWISEENR